MRRFITGAVILLLLSQQAFGKRRAITVRDLYDLTRIEEFALSPDGRWIAYTLRRNEMTHEGKSTDIFAIKSVGGSPRQLTTHPAYDGKPCWSPDGTMLSFISERTGSRQIHAIPIDGGEAQQVTNIPTGIDDFLWSPDDAGKYMAFTTRVYPDAPIPDSTARIDQSAMSDGQAYLFERLLFRHWNSWQDGKRSHIFVMPSTGGTAWDVTPGDFNTPPLSLGSRRDFAFSPDGEEIAFVRNTDSLLAVSTNNDIFIVPSRGGTIRKITENPANDNEPVYSPDGTMIAYRAMDKPGYEADQYDLMIYHRRKHSVSNLTEDFDQDIEEIVWSPSSERIYFTCGDQGSVAIFVIELKNQKIKPLVLNGCNSLVCTGPDENHLYFLRTHMHLPHEIYTSDDRGEESFQLTFTNQNKINALEMNGVENFFYPSFDNRIVHGMLLKPPFFDPAQKYPAILLIHGGPQGAWRDEFHPRWNAQLFASRGYVVILINFRGSKGYGQDFCLAVTRNWGDGPYRDLISGLDYVINKYPFVDPSKIAAAGGSYGGYLINWIAGHTDRFRCLVSHAGIFNLASFYGATEELWFPEWEFNGTPYDNIRLYDRWSPLRHARHFTTPTLVIHGGQDFRVPVDQGLQMFTACQRQNIPSKLLYFPDEGHFIQKPKNATLWWDTVLDWIDRWTK